MQTLNNILYEDGLFIPTKLTYQNINYICIHDVDITPFYWTNTIRKYLHNFQFPSEFCVCLTKYKILLLVMRLYCSYATNIELWAFQGYFVPVQILVFPGAISYYMMIKWNWNL